MNLKAVFCRKRHNSFRHLVVDRFLLSVARHQFHARYSTNSAPLISIAIATFNRGSLLVERTLPSVFAQTYQNFEIVIVGDGCTDNTSQKLESIADKRIRFVNLPTRGKYPKDPKLRWMVAGTPAVNEAYKRAQGLWIAHLDDDDVFTPYHLEKMIELVKSNNVELGYSKMRKERTPGNWEVIGNSSFGIPGSVPHSSVFFRNYIRLFKFDINSWRFNMAVDQHTWARMLRTGVTYAFLNDITTVSPLRPGNTQIYHLAEDTV